MQYVRRGEHVFLANVNVIRRRTSNVKLKVVKQISYIKKSRS